MGPHDSDADTLLIGIKHYMLFQIRYSNITLIYIQKYMHFIICGIWALGRMFGRHQNASFYYQKVRTRSRSVSVHSDLAYDASRTHRRGRGDKTKK